MNHPEWTPGDDNVARLLAQAHAPLAVPEAFAQRVQKRLLEVAAELARQRAPRPRRMRARPRWAALAGMAALLGIIALGVWGLPRPVAPALSLPEVHEQRLTAAPKPRATPLPILKLGTHIATNRGERRRVALADGSVLSLNENTRVHHDGDRHLTLQAGEVFVEVTPRRDGTAGVPFTVATPHRQVRAIGTKFVVHTADDGTGVAVTQGRVRVNDWDGLLAAGQQLEPGAKRAVPLPRQSYLLDWTRDLVTAETPPLVPPSSHAGGALVAIDPQGQSAHLSLRKYHVDVHVEDGFARTTIDQTYFNHTGGRLEGTFYFPLPADASLSRLAMYVNGQLMEGGMVEREQGRIIFEKIVTKMKDPALLEWVDGHTFKMRVFPLEPREEKRIILSYTQRLPNLYGRLTYRFPAGHSLGAVRDWSFHARVKDGANLRWRCDSHALTRQKDDKNDLILVADGKQVTMERDLVLDLTERAGVDPVRFATMGQDGFRYLMLRYRPSLPGPLTRPRRDWVFLFESSAERDPLLARTQVEIVRTLLNNAEHDDTFAVLTAGTQVRAFSPAPLPITAENVAAATAFLENAPLLGALDLDAGLKAAAELLAHGENPVLVHLGCGQPVLGERRTEVLLNRLPRRAGYVGVAVGKHWSQDFMRRAAEQCQGYVTEINPDDVVAWRAFDLLAALNVPRLLGVQVADGAEKVRLLCPTTLLAQGEELCAIARLSADDPLPVSLCVTGTLDGRLFREVLPIASPRSDAAYLPRTWARLEIDRLLAEDAVKNKKTIIDLSKAMYVMTPYTSLLVLENEAMYAQYKVDRGRKDHWAMYPCPPTIPVVREWPAGWEGMENNQLGFFPPAQALRVKGGGGLHVRTNKVISTEEDNKLGFYPPAQALKVKASGSIHTRASNLTITEDIGTGTQNYDVPREKADSSVPGVVDPTQALGIPDARSGVPRSNVPLPPGTGGDLKNLDNPGTGGLSSSVGGRDGPSLMGQFAGRSAGTRQKLLLQQGGNPASEAAVARGLQWLALHQAQDGHWSAHDFCRHARRKPLPAGKQFTCNCDGAGQADDVIATAAAVLPFLAAGITHRSVKSTNKDYLRTVGAALHYLCEQQKPDDGCLAPDVCAHSIAVMALCEAYGLTSDPQLKRAAQRGLNFLVQMQDRPDGGWGTPHSDLFVTGWVILALKSGQMAGLGVPKATLKLADRFVLACQTSSPGIFAAKPGGRPAPLETAIGLLCLQYSGFGPKKAALRAGGKRFKTLLPQEMTNGEYLFFATQIMHNFGGDPWPLWNEGVDEHGKTIHRGMRDVLLARQDRGDTPGRSHQKGSWAADESSRLRGGRVVSTALTLLSLEIYYRYLPLDRRDPNAFQPVPMLRLPVLGSDSEKQADDARQANQPAAAWRRAARAAEQRNQLEPARQCLRRAIALAGKQPRDLASLRRDYAWFLHLVQQRLIELSTRRQPVPGELVESIQTTADAWRTVDPFDWQPCWLAGRLLVQAGERDLAWNYLTSPSMLQHGSAQAWLELARQQYWQDQYDFAERAFAVAASLQPHNAVIVWERALNSRDAGRRDAARSLLQQLDEGVWDGRYQSLQLWARQLLREKEE